MAIAVGAAWLRIARSAGIDYYVTWVAAREVADRRIDEPWTAAGRAKAGRDASARFLSVDANARESVARAGVLSGTGGELPRVGTPFLLAVIGAPSTGDYEADYTFFAFVGLLLWVGAILTLCSLFGYPLAASFLVVALVTTLFGPYLSGEGVANVHTIQAAIIAAIPAALCARRRTAGGLAAGVLLGVGAAFKPNLVPVAVPLLFSLVAWRRWRTVALVTAGAFLGAGLAFFGSALYFGRVTCWLDWGRLVADVIRPTDGVAAGNFGLPTVVQEAIRLDVGWALPIAALVLVATFEGLRSVRGRSVAEPVSPVEAGALVGLGGAILVWTARLAWYHYFVLAIPLLLFVFRPAGDRFEVLASAREMRVGALALGGFLPVLSVFPDFPPMWLALALHASLFILVVLALRILWRFRPEPRSFPRLGQDQMGASPPK